MPERLVSTEEFFGFRLGSDRKLARWDKIVDYYELLARTSDKIRVINLGPSTEGHPFLLVIVSSAENLRNLEHLKEVNAKISDPRGLTQNEINQLIHEGKAVVFQTMSIHATEVGGTQMAPELIYDLLTREDEETQLILDNVISLFIPCFNPDGQLMVTDWYEKWLGTEYEGSSLPWLYHKYTGHDNNRDAFQTNIIESQHTAKVMYQEWHPHVYQDHHHMGSYGVRFSVAPFCEPIHPHADPLIWRENAWYGSHIAYKLEEAGKTGVLTAGLYSAWKDLGWVSLGNYHNMTCLLTESASAKLATPMYIDPGQLKGVGTGTLRGLPVNKAQTNFPSPWPGGWWKLRDIVEQQKIAAWSILEAAARNRETVVHAAYLKAKRQIEFSSVEGPAAYVIPAEQHDTLTADKLIDKLLLQGVEIYKSEQEFIADKTVFDAGSYIISLEQPKSGLIKTLLGQTLYPDGHWTRDNEGSPTKPFDTATDTMAEFMGVNVVPISTKVKDKLNPVTSAKPAGKLLNTVYKNYIFNVKHNDSFRAVNLLQKSGVTVWRTDEPLQLSGQSFPKGSFIVSADDIETLTKIPETTGVSFYGLDDSGVAKHSIKQLRIGVYQRYWGGNMDEGWTRWLLDAFDFPFVSVNAQQIKQGNLGDLIDVLILPNDSSAYITGDKVEEWWKSQGMQGQPLPFLPPEYKDGIGEEGTKIVKEFVQKGGVLAALNDATGFAIDKLGLKVKNVLTYPSKEFFSPGSTLRAKVNNNHPLAYGMPDEALILNWNSPAFEILPSENNEKYEVIVRYPERGILKSGWLIGEEKIAEKIAMISAGYDKGKVILFGFRPQHRGQTHGTFKLLFNALLG